MNEKSVFTSEERAIILNEINNMFIEKNMKVEAVGYDDTNGVFMSVIVMKE